MKTKCRHFRLYGVFCVGIITLALCASAGAEPEGKSVVTRTVHQAMSVAPAKKKSVVLVYSIASAIPIPIERLGGIPTTTIPMIVVGDPRKPRY